MALDDAVRAKLRADWTDVEPALWEKLDFAWMSELGAFAYWDVEHNSPIEYVQHYDYLHRPLPAHADLIPWSKLRLAKGIHEGKAAQAATEVRDLARLCFTNELLLGNIVAVTLLGLEDVAFKATAAHGARPANWKPVDESTRNLLKRALRAVPAYVNLLTPRTYAAAFAEIKVGRCGALNEALQTARVLKPLLGFEYATEYAQLDAALASAKECRLEGLRQAWAHAQSPDGDAASYSDLCDAAREPSPDCVLLAHARWLPGVRGIIGNVLLAVGSPVWLGGYDVP